MLRIIGWLIILSIIPCIYLMLQTHLSIMAAQKLHGTVIGHIPRKGSKGGTTYSLNVEYRNRYGEIQHLISNFSSSPPSRNIGDSIIVLERSGRSRNKLFIFEDIFLPYWIWLCVGMCVGGVLVGDAAMEWLYL